LLDYPPEERPSQARTGQRIPGHFGREEKAQVALRDGGSTGIGDGSHQPNQEPETDDFAGDSRGVRPWFQGVVGRPEIRRHPRPCDGQTDELEPGAIPAFRPGARDRRLAKPCAGETGIRSPEPKAILVQPSSVAAGRLIRLQGEAADQGRCSHRVHSTEGHQHRIPRSGPVPFSEQSVGQRGHLGGSARASQRQEQLAASCGGGISLQSLDGLFIPPREPQGPAVLKGRLPPPAWIVALKHADERDVARRRIPRLELAPAKGERGLLRQVTPGSQEGNPSERPDGFGALTQPGEGHSPKDGGPIDLLAVWVPGDRRIGLGDDLSPESGRLKGPALTLGLRRRSREPVGVVHPIIEGAAGEQPPDRGGGDEETGAADASSH